MKILIIDDSEISLMLTRACLEKMGHAVVSLSNPTLVAQIYQQEAPELVLLDIVMEPLSGFDCARIIRAIEHEDSWVPIIFLSANIDAEAVSEGIGAGGDDYITKPFLEIMLQAKIEVMQRIANMRCQLALMNDRLEKLSITDTLTGVANRYEFERQIETSINQSVRHKQKFAILFIDLDDFKLINDRYGHHVGDDLLVQVSSRMKAALRQEDFIARLGGDEFAILLSNIANENSAATTAKNLLTVIDENISLNGKDIYVTASIGVACYPRAGRDASTLLQHADIAMYRAKEAGFNNFKYFSPELNESYVAVAELKKEMQVALDSREFSLMFQPKFNIKEHRIIGFEALVRWHHPTKGVISPDDFIPIAEKTGFIVPLGEWIIKNACQQFSNWYHQGHQHLICAINISPYQLIHSNLMQSLGEALQKYRLKASAIEFEITETDIMSNDSKNEQVLHALHDIGVTLSIDDFGTGYSSLSHLKCLPIDILKIDKEFVMDIPEDEDDIVIVKSVISLAKNLGIQVIAEGVETKQQLQFLVENGCDFGQGNYLSKPIKASDVASYLQSLKDTGEVL